MEANELRIGNKVRLNEADITIKSIEFNPVSQDYYVRIFEDVRQIKVEALEPIEITEELLLKFGFKKKKGFYYIKGKRSRLMRVKSSFKINLWQKCIKEITYDNGYTFNIFFVHQLQNLYFALTNEELTIK